MLYVADFETTTNPDDCRVWGIGLYSIYNDETYVFNNLNDFFEHIFLLETKITIFFHNLKFDGEFIFYWLFKNEFEHVKKKDKNHMEFTTLITDTGIFYEICIYYRGRSIKIWDSLKLMNFPLKTISKSFGIEQLKGEIDYDKEREKGYIINEAEYDYIVNDVEIVGKALNYFINHDLSKMTIASNSMNEFKKLIGKKNFNQWFPQLEDDEILRKSYKGGYTYVNEKFKNIDIDEKGIVYDVNSLYPSVMYNELLPYGEPQKYEGKYVDDKLYPVYIQIASCQFELKKDYLPIIQLKKSRLGFTETEYLKSSDGMEIPLVLTSVDLDLFLKHYDVYNLEYHEGWKFKASNLIFRQYIDKWTEVKIKASIEKNEGMRTIAKLMLNSLYGKFGTNPKKRQKTPEYNDEQVIYKLSEQENDGGVYVAMASFITAYARKVTITAAQENYDRFIYCDTDSIHLVGEDIPDIEIHSNELGKWKEEYKFIKGRFIRAKSYIEITENGDKHIACAGLPKSLHDQVTFENFKQGLKLEGKLQHSRVRGGVVLKPTTFELK